MKTITQFLRQPLMIIVVICVTYNLGWYLISTQFESNMKKDKDRLVETLRLSKTSEAQIFATAQGFDRITSNVETMAKHIFALGVILTALVSWNSIKLTRPLPQTQIA